MTTTLSASVVEPDPILNTGDLPALGKLPKTRLYGQYKERSASVWMRKGFIPALRSELGTLPCDLPCGHRLKVLRRTKVFFDLLRSRIVA